MAVTYSLLYNAVILPVTPADALGGRRFQISASRNDREVPRYLSPAWSESELRAAFVAVNVTELQYQELLRGNRLATGGRSPRRLLFTEQQLQTMGLYLEPETLSGQMSGQLPPTSATGLQAAHEVEVSVFPESADPAPSNRA